MAPTATPAVDCFPEAENEGTPDEYLVAVCDHCGEEIMTMIGQDQDGWVHCITELTECQEAPAKKLSKALLVERVELLEELLSRCLPFLLPNTDLYRAMSGALGEEE